MSATTTRIPVRAALLAWLVAGCGAGGLETGDPIITRIEPTAAERWRRDVGRAVEWGPIPLQADWLVAPTEGPLLRLSGRNGSERWKRKLPSGAASDPVLCAGLVVVATDVPSGQILAVDPATGEVRWKWERSVGYLAARDSLLAFAGRGGKILRFHPADGTVLWEASRPGSGWRAPVFLGSAGPLCVPVRPDSVIAFDLEGNPVWSRWVGGWPRLGAGDGVLYVATDDSLLASWDGDTGDALAERPLPALVAGRPVPGGEALYLTLRDGRVWALDPTSLEERWSARFEAPLISPPVLAGSLLYQSGTRGRVYVLDAATGAAVDTLLHPEPLVAPPGFGPEGIAVGGDEGTLVAFRSFP